MNGPPSRVISFNFNKKLLKKIDKRRQRKELQLHRIVFLLFLFFSQTNFTHIIILEFKIQLRG
jgi:hypothetical protein